MEKEIAEKLWKWAEKYIQSKKGKIRIRRHNGQLELYHGDSGHEKSSEFCWGKLCVSDITPFIYMFGYKWMAKTWLINSLEDLSRLRTPFLEKAWEKAKEF